MQIIVKANSRVRDQTPQYTASDLGLHCMYTCVHRAGVYGINVCLRVGTCVHSCMCVLVCLSCMYTSVTILMSYF